MYLIELLNKKELIYPFLLSLFWYCFNYAIYTILIYIDDYTLFFINNIIIYESNELSDESSDDEIDNFYLNNNDKIEYKNILSIFNITNNTNINNCQYIKEYDQVNIINNEIYIINAFLFNYNETIKDTLDIGDIFMFTKKLVIMYNINKRINTKLILDLNLGYKYMYILYKKNTNEYSYLIIDLFNNVNIINTKPLLFNNITL